MAMQKIPLSKIPAQSFNVILAGQYCLIVIYWRQERLYMDVMADGQEICRGAVCENRSDIIQSPTPYFKGSLHFIDTEGHRPPHWEGLGTRYRLFYVSADEELPEGLRF